MKVDSLWHDLAIYLDKLPDHFNSTEALKRQEDAVDEAWEMTRLESPRVKEILSPLQLQLLGGMVHMLLNAKEKVHIRMWRY